MAKVQNENKRRDKDRIVLRRGESQRANGSYMYRWVDEDGNRKTIYAKTLDQLREQEEIIEKDRLDRVKTEARFITLDDVYELWVRLKRGLRDNTFQNYIYLYGMFVKPLIGDKRVATLLKSDIKRFYNTLVDERGLAISTVDSVHTVLHQVLDMAVDDNYIRNNPSNNVLKELKQARDRTGDKRRALTRQQQGNFLSYIKGTEKYLHWYPIFAVMLGTGMRVGETIGLRWCDVDLDKGLIDINHIFSDEEAIKELAQMKPAGVSLNYPNLDAFNSRLVDVVHGYGLKLCLRAGDNAEQVERMKALGLDYVPTNCFKPE